MEGLINFIKKSFNYILLFSIAISHIMLFIIVLVVLVNVFLRYVLNSGIPWGEELPCYVLLPGYVVLAMVVGIKEDSHIDLNILPSKLPKAFSLFLHYLKYLLIIFIGAVITYYGIYLAIFFRSSILVSLHLPNSIQFIFFPVSGIMTILIGIIKLFNLEKEGEHIKNIITGDDSKEKSKGGFAI